LGLKIMLLWYNNAIDPDELTDIWFKILGAAKSSANVRYWG
jgi:hypothetical protein